MKCEEIKKKLFESVEEKKVLIACHRGTNGANIIQNTILSYKNSILHGADMVEIDLSMTKDEVIYAFHNGNEKRLFGGTKDISMMTSKEIDESVVVNQLDLSDGKIIEKFDDVIREMKGKCFINIDRAWSFLEKAISIIEKHDVLEYVILKTLVDEKYLKIIEKSKVMYMPIVHKRSEIDLVKSYDINLVAVELIFDSLEHELIDKDYLKSLIDENILLWVNAITLSDKHLLAAGYGDNLAIEKGLDNGFKIFFDLGFNIIQTDWPSLLKDYRYTYYKK